MPEQSLERRPAFATSQRAVISPEQAKLIRDTVASECNDAEFHFFMEVAANYDLHPLAGEVYAAKMPGKNGASGKVVVIVGRNGWLKIARRHDDFVGMDGDVVYKNDTFKIERTADGRKITHEYDATEDRGEMVGAWCEVYRKGHPPTFFFANANEYKPSSPHPRSPWSNQPTVMMLKCAQVTALRLTYNVSGLYDEAEMAKAMTWTAGRDDDAPPEVEIDYGPDEEVADYLRALVVRANEITPGSWRPEKVRLKLEGRNDDDREALIAELVRFIEAKGGEVPEREEPVEAEVVS